MVYISTNAMMNRVLENGLRYSVRCFTPRRFTAPKEFPVMKIFRTSLKLMLASALALGGLAATAPLAQAEPVPVGQELYVSQVGAFQNPNNNTVFGMYVTPASASGAYATDGTILTLDTYSCGNPVASETKVVNAANGRGGVVNYTTGQQARVGPSIEFTLTITQPGYEPYTRSGSYSGYTVARPSCAQINDPTPPPATNKCLVKSWSKKVSTARNGTMPFIGGPVKVSRTKVVNCKASYTWTLNGKKVSSWTQMYLKRSMKGKLLAMTIRVQKPGYTGAKKVIKYGRVR